MPGELPLITTGASALPAIGGLTGFHVPDSRIRDDATLPNGPFWLHGKSGSNGTNTLPYDSYTGNPAHRFYQMWQETDCSVASATAENPSGCLNDLFPWVETTISAGTNGSLPTQYDAQGNVVPYDALTYSNPEGATSMGFYNMAAGDVPYFKQLADQYTISDNNHQGVMGGTGANHIMIGYADMIWYSDGNGHPATPPKGQIEDPNPAPKTNNIYAEDGYGNGAIPGNGGSYSNCADTTQPGVAPITEYLAAIKVPANCQAATADGQGYYYLLNNYNPAYVGNGTLDPTDTGPFTIPATPVRHIGDALNAAEVSWAYYGESWNDYLQDPNQTNNPAGYLYCNICNPFAFSTSTMTNETERKAHLHDTTDLYNDLASGNLPAVSFVKPNTLNDGHPASSKVDLFESFTHKVIAAVKANPELWKTTAILVTFDEGGGYWDSGYIQPVDFFGDGPRIPLIAVSPFAVGGRVVHTYYDHASIPKFIEANWRLKPLTGRSRDNLPNPKHEKAAPYVPTNRPSIGNLMDLFVFPNTSDTPTD
jgi:phospholipase C